MNETVPITFLDTHFHVLKRCNSSLYPDLAETYTWKWNYSNTRSGSDNPMWRRTVALGGDATTNFAGVKHSLKKYRPGSVHISYTCTLPAGTRELVAYGIQSNKTCVPAVVNGANSTAALSQAKSSFVRKARQAIHPFQGAVALGEVDKTLRMLRSPMRSLFDGIKSYHGALKKIPQRLKPIDRKRIATDTYLEYTFGWRPFLSDIASARKALDDWRRNRGFEVIRIVGSGKQSFSAEERYTTPFTRIRYDNVDLCTEEYSVLIKGGVRVEPVGCDPLAAAGLSFDEFLPTAWELLPYSFVADYFANIGDIIDAFSLVDGRLAYCSQNIRRLQKRKCLSIKVQDAYLAGSTSVAFTPGYHEFVRKEISRAKLSSVVPDFRFRLPSFGSKPSLNVAILALSKTIRTPFW